VLQGDCCWSSWLPPAAGRTLRPGAHAPTPASLLHCTQASAAGWGMLRWLPSWAPRARASPLSWTCWRCAMSRARCGCRKLPCSRRDWGCSAASATTGPGTWPCHSAPTRPATGTQSTLIQAAGPEGWG
jgi:hypothetical protein